MAKGRADGVRVAILGRVEAPVSAALRQLPQVESVQSFGGLYADFDAIRDYLPQVIFLTGDEVRTPDLGTIRLLAQSCPRLITVFVITRELEIEIESLARRAGARVLVTPCDQDAVATAIAPGNNPIRPSTPSAFLDIARGLADEIGNPLMFASGHLQLLRASLDLSDADNLARCTAVQDAISRIERTMQKVKTLARLDRAEPVNDLLRVTDLVVAARAAVEFPDTVEVTTDAAAASLTLVGEADLLTEALTGLIGVATDLASADGHAAVRIRREKDELRIELHAHGRALDAWETERSFEPYYLSRALRGSPHGLTLFLTQAIARAHGGRAVARRRKRGDLELAIALPLG